MAAFFPRNLYGGHAGHGDQGFTPLFRLLEDFDRYSTGSSRAGPGGRAAHIPTFQPKFDVRETEHAYELHGELAGITRDDVHIEFTDPQTLHVRGRVERAYTAGTPPSGFLEGGSSKQQQQAQAGTITEAGESSERPGSPQDHHAKVQDEAEAEAEEKDGSQIAESPAQGPGQVQGQGQGGRNRDSAKYWVSERSIGEFSRNFTFPSRVDQDDVRANLKDGILTVVVPKTKKREARRIEVS